MNSTFVAATALSTVVLVSAGGVFPAGGVLSAGGVFPAGGVLSTGGVLVVVLLLPQPTKKVAKTTDAVKFNHLFMSCPCYLNLHNIIIRSAQQIIINDDNKEGTNWLQVSYHFKV
jgi:predicted phage tail protein